MPPVVSFVGWHNSGKTTLTRQVVAHLKTKGYSVAVIKSTKETGIEFDQPGTDTALYKTTGADVIALLAPDQLIIQRRPLQTELFALSQFLFPEVDIVIAEGFKQASQVPKIEVRRDPQAPHIYEQVQGVLAVASDHPVNGLINFALDQAEQIADFIESYFLHSRE
ncbi:MAG: molybdopterin-guanine dinucleotide biosynthesis protein B [Desulfobulbus sp.]|nr:molybdopterin-guanine dinucleotide biosynthesis protein B [Desulfobulbus sp.]